MINPTVVLNSNTTILVSPALTTLGTACIFFCNTSSTTLESISLFAVPNGGTPSNSNMLLNSIDIPANDSYIINMEKFVLSAGDSLVAIGAVGSLVTATPSYLEL